MVVVYAIAALVVNDDVIVRSIAHNRRKGLVADNKIERATHAFLMKILAHFFFNFFVVCVMIFHERRV